MYHIFIIHLCAQVYFVCVCPTKQFACNSVLNKCKGYGIEHLRREVISIPSHGTYGCLLGVCNETEGAQCLAEQEGDFISLPVTQVSLIAVFLMLGIKPDLGKMK